MSGGAAGDVKGWPILLWHRDRRLERNTSGDGGAGQGGSGHHFKLWLKRFPVIAAEGLRSGSRSLTAREYERAAFKGEAEKSGSSGN